MDFECLDDNFDLMMSTMALEGETCGLKHSKEDPSENHSAVNYLCHKLGRTKSGIVLQELRIPICEECCEALYDEDWIIAYCTYCNESQWIYRPKAKIEHPKGNGVYIMDVCPHCAEVVNEYKKK